MPIYIAFVRAVNVAGTTLPMAALLEMCRAAGFERARTCLASGNALFSSRCSAPVVKARLSSQVFDFIGKSAAVQVRTSNELAAVLTANPFPEVRPHRLLTFFLESPPPDDALQSVRGQRHERLALGRREIYVAYSDGIAASKLIIPAARSATARNMNTLARLSALAAAL